MILSDKTITEMLDSGKLVVEPLAENSIQPASIDCRLGDHFLLVDENRMDCLSMNSEIRYRSLECEDITLPPHSFLLATTLEYVEVPSGLTAFVEGRSSIGRMGLFIQNAGWVDSGFKGNITLELYNANSLPIRLTAGKRICQLVICQMDQPSENPYKGKYQGQTQSVGSRVYLDK